MITDDLSNELFKQTIDLIKAGEHAQVQLIINGLDPDALVHFTQYISKQVMAEDRLTELDFADKRLSVKQLACIYVDIFIKMQCFFEPNILSSLFKGDIQSLGVDEKKSYCFSMLNVLYWIHQVKSALFALPDVEQLLSLNLLHERRDFLRQFERLFPASRMEILKLMLRSLPEILYLELPLLSEPSPLTQLFSLLLPSEGLSLLVNIADERGIDDFTHYLGCFRQYLTQYMKAEKLLEIRKHIVSEVALRNLAHVEDDLDNYLVVKTQLKHYQRTLKETMKRGEAHLNEMYQKRLHSAAFFLEVVCDDPRFHTTLEIFYEHKQNAKGSVLADYLENTALKKLLCCLEQDLINEALVKADSSDSDDALSTYSSCSPALFFSQKKTGLPMLRGLRCIDINPGDNSFFVAFNVARRAYHAPIDDTVMRSIIAREMLNKPSVYAHLFDSDLEDLYAHARLFKSFDLRRGTYQNLEAGLFHVKIFSELLRVPIIIIVEPDAAVTANTVHMFSEFFLEHKKPVFLYLFGSDYTAFELTGECTPEEILDDLRAGSSIIPLGLV